MPLTLEIFPSENFVLTDGEFHFYPFRCYSLYNHRSLRYNFLLFCKSYKFEKQ